MEPWHFWVLSWVLAWISGLCFTPAMNWLLPKIRGAVYTRGYRPSPGTILFSPSLNMKCAFEDGWILAMKASEKHHPSLVEVIVVDSPEESFAWTSETLLQASMYCPVCGAALDAEEDGAKECSYYCGKLRSTDNGEGLPILVFDPA